MSDVMTNDNIPAGKDQDDWPQPQEGSVLTFIEIEGRLVKYLDRDPEVNRQVREGITRINLSRSDPDDIQ